VSAPRERATRVRRDGSAQGRIQDASTRLFAQHGFQATGIRDIAAAAGVTTAALYHYVGAKEELLVAIMNDVMEPLIDGAQRIVATHESPEQRLAALVEHHVRFHATQQLATLVADTEIRSLSDAPRAEVIARRDVYEGIWRQVIAEGIAAGTFRVEDAWIATIALLQMCTGVAHWYRPTGPLTLDQLTRRYVDLALFLLRASRGGTQLRADVVRRTEAAT
jgi:AcrR family transcriptional regulator